MPPRKGGSPASRGIQHRNSAVDTPRPEAPTPARPKRQLSKAKTSVNTKRKKRQSPAIQSDDSSLEEIEVLLSSSVNPTNSDAKPLSSGLGWLRRLWNTSSSTVLLVGCVLLCAIWLKLGEEEFLSVTSNGTRANLNPYHVLKVKNDASKAQIRKAYRTLTLKMHPDRQVGPCDDECQDRFNELQHAYKILMDDDRRAMYDEYQYDSMSDSKKSFAKKIEYWEFFGSEDIVRSILKPSLHGGQLSLPPHVTGAWAYLVADARQDLTSYILKTWTEISSTMYGKVAFMRVEGSDEAARKSLPLNPVMLPAIVYCDPISGCEIYSQLLNYGPVTFPKWLISKYPRMVEEWRGSITELVRLMRLGRTEDGRTPLVVTGGLRPPNVIQALALRSSEAYKWIYTSSVEIVNQLKIEKFDLDKGTRGLIISPNANRSVVQLHGGLWQLDQERWYRERAIEGQEDVKSTPHGHAYLSLIQSLRNVSRVNEMPLREETLAYLCLSPSPQEKVICRVRVNPDSSMSPADIHEAKEMNVEVHSGASTESNPDEEELEIEGETEDSVTEEDESEDQFKDNLKTTTIQLVRLNTETLGGLRSALVHLAQGIHDTEFYIDLEGGLYRAGADKEWKKLSQACDIRTGGGPIHGMSCAPRAHIGVRERTKLFLLRPLATCKIVAATNILHLTWAIPAMALYIIGVGWMTMQLYHSFMKALKPNTEA